MTLADMHEKTRADFEAFTVEANTLCSYIDIRTDNNGPFIFAFGLKDTHSLQLRKLNMQYVLELWHGKNTEEEYISEEISFLNSNDAFSKAIWWLSKDAV